MGEGSPGFRQIQWEFASSIRDPSRFDPPRGVPAHRMAVYQDLFFNNIENFIASGFPVMKSLMTESAWKGMIRDFYAHHRCETPFFIGIAEEFLIYLCDERRAPGDPPFLPELAHYEWIELVLAVDENEPPSLNPGDVSELHEACVALSPVARRLGYQFPVHRIGPAFMPNEPPESPTYLVVYRDREDAVRFLEVNAVIYRFLEQVDTHSDATLRQILLQVVDELRHPEPENVLQFGTRLVLDLHQRGILELKG
ncbi:MAG: DUF2063 domain-containing protein [Methylococcus sp.]